MTTKHEIGMEIVSKAEAFKRALDKQVPLSLTVLEWSVIETTLMDSVKGTFADNESEVLKRLQGDAKKLSDEDKEILTRLMSALKILQLVNNCVEKEAINIAKENIVHDLKKTAHA